MGDVNGLGIALPLLVLAVGLTGGVLLARRLRRPTPPSERDDPAIPTAAAAARLTSTALVRFLPEGWRLVPELAADTLGGIEHVAIGPAGVFAFVSSMDPPPEADPEAGPVTGAGDPGIVADSAIRRAELDAALAAGAPGVDSRALVTVHWGRRPTEPAPPPWQHVAHGTVAAAGRELDQWFASLPRDVLTPARVDQAWHAVLRGAGRPVPDAG
jgi:hypothetical protein